MSYQKQKEKPTIFQQQSSSSLQNSQKEPPNKRKRITKHENKIQDESQEIYNTFSKKKKEVAKQIKRIRQQNRRATHKQYVANLQLQLKKKELQIQNLELKIKGLQLQLQSKVCHKCGGELTEAGSITPFPNEKEVPIELVSLKSVESQKLMEEEDHDDSFRRITDDSSLRICFGNKNLLFFFVTMCCLTMGSIADNPELFLQPIHPFMLKSEMCFLRDNYKLDKFQMLKDWINPFKSPQVLYQHFSSTPPRIYQDVHRVSSHFNFNVLLKNILPTQISFINLKDPGQLLLNFGANNLIQRLFNGRNYYF